MECCLFFWGDSVECCLFLCKEMNTPPLQDVFFRKTPVKMNGDVLSKLRLKQTQSKKSRFVSLQTHRHPFRGDIFTHFDGP